MVDQPRSHDFLYVASDIPPGLTIKQWRAQRAAEHAAHQHPAHAGSKAACAKTSCGCYVTLRSGSAPSACASG